MHQRADCVAPVAQKWHRFASGSSHDSPFSPGSKVARMVHSPPDWLFEEARFPGWATLPPSQPSHFLLSFPTFLPMHLLLLLGGMADKVCHLGNMNSNSLNQVIETIEYARTNR